MKVMKAIIREGVLGYMFTFKHDYPKPDLNSKNDQDKLLVKINSAAINPVDYKVPRAMLGPVVGMDFCGTVEEVGELVDPEKFKVGDIVFGGCMGSLSEFSLASTNIAKAPKDKQWKSSDLAALNIAYLSALQCLKKGIIVNNEGNGGLNKSVLIIGASGGCGIAGLQLSKASGTSRIVAICSSKNSELVKKNGATEVLDYANQVAVDSFFQENVGQFDCILDAATGSGMGEDYWDMSVPLLKKDVGEYVSLNGSKSKWIRVFLNKQKKRETLLLMKPNPDDLELVVKMLDASGVRPLTNVYSFSHQGLVDAFDQLKSRRTKGKIVFDISD